MRVVRQDEHVLELGSAAHRWAQGVPAAALLLLGGLLGYATYEAYFFLALGQLALFAYLAWEAIPDMEGVRFDRAAKQVTIRKTKLGRLVYCRVVSLAAVQSIQVEAKVLNELRRTPRGRILLQLDSGISVPMSETYANDVEAEQRLAAVIHNFITGAGASQQQS